MIGRVVSTKMNNTITVLVERVAKHRLYKKTFTRSKKYLVDDPKGVKEGDIVEIVKIRPVSKNKHWQVTKVIGQNLAEIVEAQQKEAAAEIISEVMPESSEESDEIGKNQSVSELEKEATETPTNRPTDTPKKRSSKSKKEGK